MVAMVADIIAMAEVLTGVIARTAVNCRHLTVTEDTTARNGARQWVDTKAI